MAKMTYGEQLKHPNWQRKRLEALEASGWACDRCGTTERTLHVHHKQYFKGRMAWEYEITELAVLCEECHAEEHKTEEVLKEHLLWINQDEVVGLISGFAGPNDCIDPEHRTKARDINPLAYAAGLVAYITYGLDIKQMALVAQFAADMHTENAEARMVFVHRTDEFGGW